MSIWHIEEFKPRTPRAQPNLQSAYTWDKNRNLPDLEAGFRVQSSDQARVPYPSYLYVENPVRLSAYDPYSWGPEYESILQKEIDQNDGYICPVDAVSQRDGTVNHDGFPLSQPPQVPFKGQQQLTSRDIGQVKGKIGGLGADIGKKRKGFYPEEISNLRKGYFPTVTFNELEKNAKEEEKEKENETKEKQEEEKQQEEVLLEKVFKETKKVFEETKRNTFDEAVEQLLKEEKQNQDPTDADVEFEMEQEEKMTEAQKQFEAASEQERNIFEQFTPKKEKILYESTMPMRTSEYAAVFSPNISPPSVIFMGGSETPTYPARNRSTTLQSSAQQDVKTTTSNPSPGFGLDFPFPGILGGVRPAPNTPLSSERIPKKQQVFVTPQRPVQEREPITPDTPEIRKLNIFRKQIAPMIKKKYGKTVRGFDDAKDQLTLNEWTEVKRTFKIQE